MPASDPPETFEEALAWAKVRCADTGSMPATVSNPTKGLLFDLKSSTLTRSVRDEDNNLVEMTYCALTGNLLAKRIAKPSL